MIQPQVPLRLPCYDFAPVTEFTFGGCLLAVGPPTLGAPSFHGVTGGVYKARERIHRGVADPRLLAIPTSRRRVAASDLNWGVIWGDFLQLALSGRSVDAIVARVWPWA